MTIGKLIRVLMRSVVILRDVNAVRKGRVHKRIYNKMAGRMVGRLTRKVWWR
mgnify:FL=1